MKDKKNDNLIPLISGAVLFILIITAFSLAFIIRNSKPNVNQDISEILEVKEPKDAPQIEEIENWFNSDPLEIDQLKGKVVLVDFWTYSCINCIRNIPFINKWYEKYKDEGLEIIGMHSPEFEFEKNPADVEKAIRDYGIKYPVALDNNFKTWQNFENKFWPALYFINKEGKLVHYHYGEGGYDVSEKVIRYLLGFDNIDQTDNREYTPPITSDQTQEIYLGYERAKEFENILELKEDEVASYELVEDIGKNKWSIGGNWKVGGESITSAGSSKLIINFSSKDLYLVMGSNEQKAIKVLLNGETKELGDDANEKGEVIVNSYKLYRIVKQEKFMHNSVLILEIPEGVTLNAFTFGS